MSEMQASDSEEWRDHANVQHRLARHVAVARVALKLSQAELADKAGVSRATIVQVEAAAVDLQLSTLDKIAKALGMSPMFLLLGRDELLALTDTQVGRSAKLVQARLTDMQLESMRRMLHSGVPRKSAEAVETGSQAARAAGLGAGVAGAAIGTLLLPGIGTALGAALVALFAAKSTTSKRDREG